MSYYTNEKGVISSEEGVMVVSRQLKVSNLILIRFPNHLTISFTIHIRKT